MVKNNKIFIQSFSDIITNSSSELFTIEANQKIIDFIESLYQEYIDNEKWYWGGEACGMILQTITESYIEDINSEYSSDLIFELDYIYSEKIIETFPNKDISFDTYSLIINIHNFSLEEYIKLLSIRDECDYTENSIFIRVDYGNKGFIDYIENVLEIKLKSIE